MKIEVWSDFVCPFCYIGKRKLDKALSKFENEKVEVVFRSYQLSPNAPEVSNEVGYAGFAKTKHIPIDQAKSMMDSIAQRAKEYGLNYQMDKTQTTSTFKAHRLAKWARTQNKEKEVTEAFFNAYFTEGVSMSDENKLLEIVTNLGLNKDEAKRVLENNLYEEDVNYEIQEAQKLGVSGVPFFVVNRKYAISGAQPDAYFDQVLQKAADDEESFETVGNSDDLCGPDDVCGF